MIYSFFLKTGSHYEAQAGLEPSCLLPQLWSARNIVAHQDAQVDMFLNIEKPTDSIENLLVLKNESSNVAWYKVNTQK
jgi:hypothetical protein